MYILSIYKASFDSDENLIPILEPKFVSDNINLLKKKLIEILEDENIKLNAYQEKKLQAMNNYIEFDFDNGYNKFNWYDIVSIEIKEIKELKQKKHKIELKNNYSEYIKKPKITEVVYNVDSIDQLKKIANLLALRDQECFKSRGYKFQKGKINFTIKKDLAQEKGNEWVTTCTDYYYFPDRVYFKTEKDAQKICDILNSGKFTLEGE